MKKLISIILCLTLLVSALAFSASADDELTDLIELIKPYGVGATYATQEIDVAPVIDGVVNENEYTYVRSYTNLTSDDEEYPDYRANNNFGVNCYPNNGVVIKEFIAVDEDNIYLAFEFGQDLSDFMLRINPTQIAAFDCASAYNTLSINFELPEGVDLDDVPLITFQNDVDDEEYLGDVNGKNKFRALYDEDDIATPEVEADEVDGIAKRNFEADEETVKNITAEFRFSKAGILDATGDEELRTFGYFCKGKRTVAGANCPEGADVTLQQRLSEADMLSFGYMASYEIWSEYYSTVSQSYYSDYGRLLRFICFYEEPVGNDEPATDAPATDAPATDAPATDATTAAATTEAPKSGCGSSIALSALAIVPVLGLGVAFASKKKEN